MTATATDGSGATGTASITISSLVLSPTSTTVVAGETQPYSSSPSSVPVSYSATVGLGSFIGNIFTAANTTGSGTVTATATDGSGASGTAKISVTPFAISPNSPSVAEGQTLTLNANAPANWSATGDGSVPNTCTNTTSCVFTANTTGTQAMVTATEVNSTERLYRGNRNHRSADNHPRGASGVACDHRRKPDANIHGQCAHPERKLVG